MRALLRTAIIIGGAAALAVVVLLALAAVTGSWIPAVAAAVLGAAMAIAGVLVAARVIDRFAAVTSGTATRLRNFETRAAGLAGRATELEELAGRRVEEVAVLAAEVERMGVRLGAAAHRLDGAEFDAAGLRVDLNGAGEAIARTRESVEENQHVTDGLRAALREVVDDAASMALRIDEGAAETVSVRRSVQNLDASLTRTRGRLEPVRRDVRNLRERVPSGFLDPVEARVADVSVTAAASLRMAFETGIQQKRDPRSLLTPKQARKLFDEYLQSEQYLQLKPLIESFDLLSALNLATLRSLYRFYRTAGYWNLALRAATTLHEKSGRENDALAAAKLRSEIAVFSEPALVTTHLPDGDAYDPTGPILHMVGRVLPETQTGYTLRTQYTAQAQARKGLPVAIVGQAGITDRSMDDVEPYTYQGVDYFLLPGPARSKMLLEDWVRANMVQLAELVRRQRPSVLQAHSDFFNALIVSAVGKKYGIPTVYESRGFWEESWLSRTITSHQWTDPETLFSMYGLPEAYTLRKHAEEVARLLPDRVFTLANVMREHIIEASNGELGEQSVALVPNAVEAQNFPVQEPDRDLAARIGIPDSAVTVGYISSIVEYEGIDTLIDAFQLAAAKASTPMCLLLVGDGNYLPVLKNQVERKGVENVFFTGRVPHEDVLRYYGLIDLFVVPRKPSRVAELVTPLKPFEAFSTGRAVIVSDVGALQEIADQSGAVETFRAGSSLDLSQKLTALIENEVHRRQLSERAARWVRSHRTWDSNASEYYRVYKQLGYAGPRNPVIEAESALNERGCHPGELLRDLQEADVPAATGWFSIEQNSQTASEILNDGWQLPSHDPVRVTQITDWSQYGKTHRSWGFHLQSWEFLDPLIHAYDVSGEQGWLDEAVRIATNWIDAHVDEPDVDESMAWYDMSVALRTPRLISVALRASRVEALRDQTIRFAETVTRHLDELYSDRAFNPRNNHGFYTAVAQIHAAKHMWMLPGTDDTRVQGQARLAHMAASQFAPDGVHTEHSPDYHRMLLMSFEAALTEGLIDDEEVQARVKRAAHVLGWMIQPDGTLVQFGDTRETQVVTSTADSTDTHTRYLLTDGERGERPTEELAVFADGGYAFVRSPQPEGRGTLQNSGYLAFSASFHSRAHKHADDLNVVWYDRGQQILVDGGRYGYGELLAPDSPLRSKGFYYATPERQYVESTMAHNTLMIDGRDHERRAREPYGAALGECVDKRGVFDLSARVQHSDYIHRRRVIYRPGRELQLRDSVFSHLTEVREATLWLNIDGSFQLESAGGEIVLVHPERGLRLTISSDAATSEPIRAQEEPLRGWRSRNEETLEPAWSLALGFTVTERSSIDTYLRIEKL
ncbi:glycosyltransferase [Brachybacterium sp.]|uniref:glycosyltransferase n=1 Tax=Brachybacterium sp. TaxID=1891286 RepID=UPI002ED04480